MDFLQCPFFFVLIQKYAPFTVSDERGAKNTIVFTAARSLQHRSYAADGARYLQADLMLLTHAECAFKGPRGRFGISFPPRSCSRAGAGRAYEIKTLRCGKAVRSLYVCFSAFLCRCLSSFALLHCAVTASAEPPPYGLRGRCKHIRSHPGQ